MLELFVKHFGELLNQDYVSENSDIEYELELDCPDLCEILEELENQEVVPCSIENCEDFPAALRTVGDLYDYLIDYCKNKT